MVYDIRTKEKALDTLITLTGVEESIWIKYTSRINEYPYIDNMIEDVVNKFGSFPSNYLDFEFIYSHITTSSNNCESIKKYGLLDLCNAYECTTSELRMFLDEHGIEIDLSRKILIYQGKKFDISYPKYRVPFQYTKEYDCWAVGRKFYFDYTSCGFLSVCERNPYGGYVHKRPEILMDIDNLLGLKLSEKWEYTHKPFEIVVKVIGENIVYPNDDSDNEKDKVLYYLVKAFINSFYEPSEEVILLKNGITIPTQDILEIKELEYWW